MSGRGGKTTFSGTKYQAEITVLYLGRLLDPRNRGENEKIDEVRPECDVVAKVDDILVRFQDGHTEWFQVKENLDNSGNAWKTMWDHFKDQLSQIQHPHDRIVLILGYSKPWSKDLRELLDRAKNAKDSEEWPKTIETLSKDQGDLANSLCELIGKKSVVDLYGLLSKIDIRVWDADRIRLDQGPNWMPESNYDPLTLYDKLFTIVCNAAEKGKSIDQQWLLDKLKNEKVQIYNASSFPQFPDRSILPPGSYPPYRSLGEAFTGLHEDLPAVHPPPTEGPLRILIITASPPGQPPVGGQRQEREITGNLVKRRLNFPASLELAVSHVLKRRSLKGLAQHIRQRRLVEVDVLEHATRQSIQHELCEARNQKKGYHVIHFIGHGEAGGKPVLLLEPGPGDSEGSNGKISADEFAELVAGPAVYLVVLNVIETALEGLVQSISRAVMERGVPAVVGMQIKGLDKAILEFSAEFYGAWATGESIEGALAYARRLVTGFSRGSTADWDTPVLYMGPEGGIKLALEAPLHQAPGPVRAVRWAVGLFLSIISTLSLLFLTLPELNRTMRTQVPGIKCIFPYPMAADPSFNVAVAEFAVQDENGNPVKGRDGYILANDMRTKLLEEIDAVNPSIYHEDPRLTCPVKGKTTELRRKNAQNLAERIRADILIYGTIVKRGNEGGFTPEFYVNYEGLEQAPEIVGEHQFASRPMPLILPLEEVEIQHGKNIGLYAREEALIQIVLGLACISEDNYAEAMNYFTTADEYKGWSDDNGRTVLYLLMGDTSQLMATTSASDMTSEEYWLKLDEARTYFGKAVQLDDQYARAQLGLANVLYLEALGFGDTLQVDSGKLSSAAIAYTAALKMQNAPESANIPSKVHFGLGQIYIVEDQLDQAESEFLQIVGHYQGGDESIEYIACHAYARLGWIAGKRGDYPRSIDLLNKAIDLASPVYQVKYRHWLAEIYRAANEKSKACEMYQSELGWAERIGDERSIQDQDLKTYCLK